MKITTYINKSSICVLALLMGGCTTFGVSNEQWNKMNNHQREITMNQYYLQQQAKESHQAEVDRINAQNAPINNLIKGLVSFIPSKTRKETHTHSKTNDSCFGNTCTKTMRSRSTAFSFTSPF
jgi:hypothetical protein